MRKTLLLLVLMMVLVGPALLAANGTGSASAIPVPDGAKVTDEGAFDTAEIKSMIDSAAKSAPGFDKRLTLDMESLKQSVAPIKAVQFASMELKGSRSAADIISFFEAKVQGRRIIYNINGPEGVIVIATEDGGYFGALIDEFPSSKSTVVKNINAGRIFGSPDVGKAVKAFLPPFLYGMSMAADPSAFISPKPKQPSAKKPTPTKPKRK